MGIFKRRESDTERKAAALAEAVAFTERHIEENGATPETQAALVEVRQTWKLWRNKAEEEK